MMTNTPLTLHLNVVNLMLKMKGGVIYTRYTAMMK